MYRKKRVEETGERREAETRPEKCPQPEEGVQHHTEEKEKKQRRHTKKTRADKKAEEVQKIEIQKRAEMPIAETVQPEINIGLVGHVDHGKTTLTERLTGKWTDTHSEEIRLGITIRLGYADTTLRRCPKCEEPECYTTKERCPKCNSETIFLRKISFIDAPGHESLMATMLSGATIMDAALLLVAANEPCPQPQTREHLTALQIIGIKDIIIVQNKIDLVSKEEAMKNYQQIRDFIKETPYKDALIIPISAQQNINIDLLVEALYKYFPKPLRDETKEPIMLVARSFDINRPGTDPLQLRGGVLGGTLKQGVLKAGDTIEIRPGRRIEREGRSLWIPITTNVVSLMTGGVEVGELKPGGSIAVMTSLDPSIVKADSLSGSIAGIPGKLPRVWHNLKLKNTLLERVVGTRDNLLIEPIKMDEFLMLNVNSAATVGKVTKLGKDMIECTLKIPVCADAESRVTISRKIGDRYRLIGYGIIKE